MIQIRQIDNAYIVTASVEGGREETAFLKSDPDVLSNMSSYVDSVGQAVAAKIVQDAKDRFLAMIAAEEPEA